MTEKLKLPTLLVISDNPSIWQWVKRELEGQFFIIRASRQFSATETARTTELDFIILDANFEECDPLELARELRQINTITPILLITGRLKKSFRDAALDAGVTDFLNESLSIEELETRIATGKRAASARKKTSEISTRLKGTKQELSQDFFKNKVLLNKKAIDLLANVKKQKDSIMLLLLRIDHFQDLQSQVGLIDAEELLPLLSERITRHLRPEDLLIPSSQGFFILLLPHTAPDEASAIAEELRREVQKEPFQLPSKKLEITISIALSSFQAEEEQYKRIVAQASKALQAAKAMTNLIISLDKETS
jgi:two-component system, cell cycle response regulator